MPRGYTVPTSEENRAGRLARLEREHRELVASLPAHSVRASMLIRIEELEEEIAALRAKTETAPANRPIRS
jgi:hypothetical protein